MRALALFAAGCGLLALFAQAGWWLLGFVALLPWLALLDGASSWRGALLRGALLALGYQLAALSWFGVAVAHYAGMPAAAGLLGWLLLAPLLQAQWLALALARHLARAQGPGAAALAGAGALLLAEWALPRLLGDTLGHGLVPSLWLRQGAELGGAALLTLLLLAVNELLWQAWQRRHGAFRAPLALALALALPLAAASYGALRVQTWADAPGATPLRVGLVQANVADLEARRRAQGAEAVVRELLDLHFAMSYDAIEHQRADAVLWSETVYPTTLGRPKSAAGAAFDAEILATVAAAGRPFVIGSYDLDAAGEYNSAAFLDPQQGLLGHYRKTRLFPLTEWLPAWGQALRALLPGLGSWQPGQGARPFALRLADGRELAVQALICRDATDPMLAIAAARLGAQALFTLSNDSWFAAHPQGARLHLAVSSLRSVETRLPQWRVTSTGHSAVIDALGRVQASAGLNERTLVVGSLPVPPSAAATPMLRLGDWLGPACALLLLGMAAWTRLARWAADQKQAEPELPAHLVLLPAWARWAAAALRALACLVLLGIGLAWLLDEGFRGQTLLLLRLFAGGVLLPEGLALCLLAAYRVQARLEAGQLRLARGGREGVMELGAGASVQAWRLPLPARGCSLVEAQGARTWHLAGAEALALQPGRAASAFERARAAWPPNRLQAPCLLHGLLPLLLAVPAFLLHQQIAYGAWLGEWLTHGARAYGLAFVIWWGSWMLGVAAVAALLRGAVEAGSWLLARWRPPLAFAARWGLERGALALLYLGLPGLLALRLWG